MSTKLQLKNSAKNDMISEFESIDLGKTYGIWKSPLLSVNYELINDSQELQTANEKLEEKKKEYSLHEADMRTKWKMLKKEREAFRDHMIKNDQLYIASKEKHKADKERIHSELKRYKEYEHQITKLEVLKKETQLQMCVNQSKEFHDILEEIVKKTEEFHDIHELINYYRVLSTTREELIQTLKDNFEDIELLHSTMTNLMLSATNKLMSSHKEISSNDIKYRNTITRLRQWNETFGYLKETAAHKTHEFEQIGPLCYNLYELLKKRKVILYQINENDAIDQLKFIKDSILKLQQIIHIAKTEAKEEMLSCKSDSSFLTIRRDI